MKYDKNLTLVHELAVRFNSVVVELDEIIHIEDSLSARRANIFPDVLVLDLDAAERYAAAQETRNRNSTMDCSFAIRNVNNVKMLLVEFRFNYTNLKNLNRKKLIDKVSGSCSLLGNSVQIYREYIFIFQSGLKAQALRRLFLMNPRVPNNYLVLDINDLKNNYF